MIVRHSSATTSLHQLSGTKVLRWEFQNHCKLWRPRISHFVSSSSLSSHRRIRKSLQAAPVSVHCWMPSWSASVTQLHPRQRHGTKLFFVPINPISSMQQITRSSSTNRLQVLWNENRRNKLNGINQICWLVVIKQEGESMMLACSTTKTWFKDRRIPW